jgi:TRAP transporter TAXI family solute receptor
MPQTLRYTLVSLREMLASAGPIALIAIALLVLAYHWLDPQPPRRVTLATGPAQSAYAEFGQRYARALAASGIQVELLESEGSADNLRLLREGRADVAFVQGGSADPAADDEDAPALVSLGSLFVEPVWVFYREAAARRARPAGTLARLSDLRGLRVNVGTRGSGVPALFTQLLAANGLDPQSLTISREPQTPATVAFLAGQLDVLVFASAPEALMVQMLLRTPGVRLMDFSQSEAYARRLPFLTPVQLPRGVVDLASDVPPRDVRLIASTTRLLAREDTHPALLQLFAQAALGLHGGAGWFNRAHEFPNTALNVGYPVSREAERAYRNGTPTLQRYLPFWVANLVERMWLALGIILAALLPLSRIVPPLYQMRVRSRVYRWYAQLRDIEERGEHEPARRDALREELDALESRVEKIAVPLSYADELYALRHHISLVRSRLLAPTATTPDRADAGVKA